MKISYILKQNFFLKLLVIRNGGSTMIVFVFAFVVNIRLCYFKTLMVNPPRVIELGRFSHR